MAADLGTIEPGRLADLIVVDGNPLSDVRFARKIQRVMKNGQWQENLLQHPRNAGAGSK